MNRTVSNENIQTITDCELLQINRDDIDIATRRSEINKQRAFDMANLTAEERYNKFVKENPTLIRNVPLGYITSYLGITQRYLSRLRKEK